MSTLSLNILGLKLDTNLKNGGDKEILKSFYSMQFKLQIIATQLYRKRKSLQYISGGFSVVAMPLKMSSLHHRTMNN